MEGDEGVWVFKFKNYVDLNKGGTQEVIASVYVPGVKNNVQREREILGGVKEV